MPEEAIIVYCTFPDADAARNAARTLVEQRLAACASILPGVESIYRWKGAIETASEVLLLIKTTSGKYQMLETRILALHPYEVPEIVSVRIDAGNPPYLHWIGENVTG
ncbi:MAG TPA: divalent-cation tolerance protein CutA [Chthoniobacteraceae bacterium]|jgi:periplasmic divalent cation tolerance protein|nr:divalent-cation tolerance protein CutA [Chthoniobacteraceae bacterium]